MLPKAAFAAVTSAYGRTVFRPAAALWVTTWTWHMPPGRMFIIHEPKKPDTAELTEF